MSKLGFEGKKPVTVTSKGKLLTLIKYSEEHEKMILQNT